MLLLGGAAFANNPLTEIGLRENYEGNIHYWSDADGSIYESADVVTNLDVSYTLGDVKTLGSYNISHNLNGGVATNPGAYNIESPTITPNKVIKENHVFVGWYLEGDFNNEITEIATGSIGDIELFARYVYFKCPEQAYDTIKITVDHALVINTVISAFGESKEYNTIKVFPNPSSDYVNFDFGNYLVMDGYILRIVDSMGDTKYDEVINNQSQSIDIPSVLGGEGFYIIYIIDANQKIQEVKKLVVQ